MFNVILIFLLLVICCFAAWQWTYDHAPDGEETSEGFVLTEKGRKALEEERRE